MEVLSPAECALLGGSLRFHRGHGCTKITPLVNEAMKKPPANKKGEVRTAVLHPGSLCCFWIRAVLIFALAVTAQKDE